MASLMAVIDGACRVWMMPAVVAPALAASCAWAPTKATWFAWVAASAACWVAASDTVAASAGVPVGGVYVNTSGAVYYLKARMS